MSRGKKYMSTTECRAVIERLIVYGEQPDTQREGIEEAISHIQTCPYCSYRLGHLIQALRTSRVDRLSCQDCQDRLPGYSKLIATGKAGGRRWTSVELHLATCPHCSAEFAEIRHLVALAQRETGVEPPSYPVPQLGFLGQAPHEPAPARAWHLDRMRRLVITFSAELLQALRPPQQDYATGMVKSSEKSSSASLYRFELAGAVEDLDVTITADQTAADPSHCRVVVRINIPSRDWPNLRGIQIVLARGHDVLAKKITNAYGEASFGEIAVAALPDLVFTVDREHEG
jgi:hypothetical protein